IVGESGSGKTTLVRCLMRLIDPDSGAINISGVDFASKTAAELRRHRRYRGLGLSLPELEKPHR
ncbi:MAG: ATP-binding cassette domain-containing protein, partial [Alphaproteobacteria bacterium]|nr:ATP-binding cassette domain-containing protein [Alphaproteobacteria bacterium]